MKFETKSLSQYNELIMKENAEVVKIQVNVKGDRVPTWNGGDNFTHLKPI